MKYKIEFFDQRRDVVVSSNQDEMIAFAVQHFIEAGQEAIRQHDQFSVALSGGSTPKSVYRELSSPSYRNKLDWSKVFLFWSDERAVPPEHPDSNYNMAMSTGLETLPLNKDHIFRMKGEGDLEQNALEYEQYIRRNVPEQQFDLVLLGMGDDGHVASLFPLTHGLHAQNRLVVANFIPSKNVWRLTMTFECINRARHIAIYVAGASKAETVQKVLFGEYQPDILPAQRIGTEEHKALWILESSAAKSLYKEV